jgi:hypothetical protein
MAASPIFSVCSPASRRSRRRYRAAGAFCGAATEQNNEVLAVPSKVNAVAGTKIDFQFEHNGTDAFDVRDIAQREPGQSCRHLRGGLRVLTSVIVYGNIVVTIVEADLACFLT